MTTPSGMIQKGTPSPDAVSSLGALLSRRTTTFSMDFRSFMHSLHTTTMRTTDAGQSFPVFSRHAEDFAGHSRAESPSRRSFYQNSARNETPRTTEPPAGNSRRADTPSSSSTADDRRRSNDLSSASRTHEARAAERSRAKEEADSEAEKASAQEKDAALEALLKLLARIEALSGEAQNAGTQTPAETDTSAAERDTDSPEMASVSGVADQETLSVLQTLANLISATLGEDEKRALLAGLTMGDGGITSPAAMAQGEEVTEASLDKTLANALLQQGILGLDQASASDGINTAAQTGGSSDGGEIALSLAGMVGATNSGAPDGNEAVWARIQAQTQAARTARNSEDTESAYGVAVNEQTPEEPSPSSPAKATDADTDAGAHAEASSQAQKTSPLADSLLLAEAAQNRRVLEKMRTDEALARLDRTQASDASLSAGSISASEESAGRSALSSLPPSPVAGQEGDASPAAASRAQQQDPGATAAATASPVPAMGRAGSSSAGGVGNGGETPTTGNSFNSGTNSGAAHSSATPAMAGTSGQATAAPFAHIVSKAGSYNANAPVTDQIAVHVSHAVGKGEERLTIRLNPSDLGRIDVQLTTDSTGQVKVAITADQSQTLDMLQRDHRGLERALSDAGLKLDPNALSFSLRDNGSPPNGGQQYAQNNAGDHDGGQGGNGHDAHRSGSTREASNENASLAATETNWIITPDRLDVRV